MAWMSLKVSPVTNTGTWLSTDSARTLRQCCFTTRWVRTQSNTTQKTQPIQQTAVKWSSSMSTLTTNFGRCLQKRTQHTFMRSARNFPNSQWPNSCKCRKSSLMRTFTSMKWTITGITCTWTWRLIMYCKRNNSSSTRDWLCLVKGSLLLSTISCGECMLNMGPCSL